MVFVNHVLLIAKNARVQMIVRHAILIIHGYLTKKNASVVLVLVHNILVQLLENALHVPRDVQLVLLLIILIVLAAITTISYLIMPVQIVVLIVNNALIRILARLVILNIT